MNIEDADAPYMMVNNDGERFFPDGPEDADYFAKYHDAYFADPDFKWSDDDCD